MATDLRTFASIVCRDCLYLEFPGCDSHQLLYTESILDGTTTHAKCPKCSAATNNQRPFREGCRRCKGKTFIGMWNCSPKEIKQAFRCFPSRIEEIDHTVVQCDEHCCASVVFPSSREVLTTRTAACALVTSSHRQLKLSNFQLSMPHVPGCPRQGMPLHAVAVRLPKSELKFVLERIEQCPIPPVISMGPAYRKRQLAPARDTNQLHQIYLRLLATIVTTFDSHNLNSLEPLKQIATLFEKSDALRMFKDWAPPQEPPITHVVPTKAIATSQADDQHDVTQLLDPGSTTYWQSAFVPPSSPLAPTPTTVEVTLEFDPPTAVQAISILWHIDYVCHSYNVQVSTNGGKAYDSSNFSISTKQHLSGSQTIRYHLPSPVVASHVKVSMMPHSTSAQDKPISFGIHHLLVYPTSVEVVYTSPSKVLQDLVTWVSSAATHSPHPAIRDFALSILQTLALASGSLCALLHVVHCLLHSPTGSSPDFSPDKTEAFLHELATCVQKVMLQSNSDHSATKSLENRIIQQMSLNLQDEVTRRTIQILQNIPGLEVYTSPDAANMATIPGLEVYSPPRPTPAAGSPAPALVPPPPISLTRNDQAVTSAPDPTVTIPAANNSHTSVDDECASPTSCPALVLLLCQRSFVKCIETRAQLAMVILSVLSELSVWQMQRMQRPEDFVGRREDELSRLEDPFSIQVSAELFGLGYTLLTELLAPWLKPTQSKLYDTLAAAAARLTQSLSSSPFSPTTGHALSSGKNSLDHRFTPNAMGLAVLQIVTSNVRRLVLSHVDPAEVGLQDGQDELIQALEHLIPLGTKRTDPLFPLSLQAAAAIEVGMEAFYPSSQQRTTLLTTRMGHGATLEFQLRWPVQEREQEDPRYERLVLILQLACIKLGFVHALRGTWGVFLHLVVALPPTQSTADVLQQCIAESIQQAGFAGWQVAAGAQEISITLQRHLHWNRVEKMGHDSGSGWIRVYPRAVATYDDVLVEVDAFVHQHAALVT
ncbi:hypothetical protein, variant [Aphanomyces invadans]|uniref:F5/8 type C domain-containing protein n=1 Tax=Aphanomyces invadans TaxID=157072 RepID=A0A024TPT5_9STRA|nr:hypothetical protein, variant [Aphanomyces invadans]ETV95347.1 hypothetical protein, variant [Aphanomyces invadans]|eukprot:XP_008876048.1 hypothetical protein, variant [Aphanomyces invadans]